MVNFGKCHRKLTAVLWGSTQTSGEICLTVFELFHSVRQQSQNSCYICHAVKVSAVTRMKEPVFQGPSFASVLVYMTLSVILCLAQCNSSPLTLLSFVILLHPPSSPFLSFFL